MKLKNLLSSLMALVALCAPALSVANEITYSYSDNGRYLLWGAKVAQTYDIAISLPGTSFEGCKITKISVPVIVTDNTSDYSIWLSKELTLGTVNGKKVNIPDIMSASVEPADVADNMGFLNLTLDNPYEVTSDGVFVGVTFNVNKVSNDLDRYPVVTTSPAQHGGLWVHTSKTYRTWSERSSQDDVVSTIAVTLDGNFSEYAVNIKSADNFSAQVDTPKDIKISIVNLGSTEVTSIGYDVTLNGVTTSGSSTLATPIPALYNYEGRASITIPAIAETGVHEVGIKITEVNGKPNGQNAECTLKANVVEILPTKRPLMEEFTGTWCGWCPRGWVAMETMNKWHSDFIGIAYHNGDEMQLVNGYPNMADGFPSAFIDRTVNCDPFYGTSNSKQMGIEDNWLAACAEDAVADISLVTEDVVNGDSHTIKVKSTVIWAMDPGEGDYRIEYVLVGDGLMNPTWLQSNYYTRYAQDEAGELMNPFCNGGEYGYSSVPFLTFNDVALLNTGGRGIEGSLQVAPIGQPCVHEYEFDVTTCPIFQEAKSLRVVGIIMEASKGYGTVLNCNQQPVDITSGIHSISTDANVVDVRYYDVQGREISKPNTGFSIKRTTYSDGTSVTSKSF